MATYFVADGGSNTSPYETWAKAATSLATALAAASTAGDVVVIQYDAVPAGDAELSATVTYTFVADNVSLISASNDGTSAYTPTVMGAANWIGHSTASRSISIASTDRRVYIYGITFRTAGASTANVLLSSTAGADQTYDSCYLWCGSTVTTGRLNLGGGSGGVRLTNCTLRFGSTSNRIGGEGRHEIEGCTISSDGSSPTYICAPAEKAFIRFVGCDLSLVSTGIIVDTAFAITVILDRCKIAAGLAPLAAQTSNPNSASSPEVYLFDCASDDTHGIFAYYNACGQLTSDTGIYFTSGDAAQSWKIVTTANASRRGPFVTPSIDVFHSGTSSITPYLEILRDGSATAYTDAEVWAEFEAKVTASSTRASFYGDRQALAAFLAGTAGSAQADGAGTGSWTGENATAKSMKIDSGSAFTPAESGPLTVRISVAAASTTVYVDPQIRGL